MEIAQLRNKTAIAGVGTSKFDRNLEMNDIGLVAEAFKNALEDSGLVKTDIDGLIVNAGPDCDRLPELLGIEVQYAAQTWAHGRLSGSTVQWAALAANAGLANHIACMMGSGSWGNRQHVRENPEAFRPGGGPHLEVPEYGMIHPGALAAMSMRRYMHLYGATAEELGTVAVTQRKHACLNPNAVYRKPITIEDYLNSRFVIEPLRLLDFAAVNSGAVCIIVTTAERARACRKGPVYIMGMQGMNASRKHVVFAREGLGAGRQDVYQYAAPPSMKVYEMAGVRQEDVDVLQIYDSFSPQVLFGLEEFGFCAAGEAASWIQGGRIELGGELPVNTSGGHLSEGMLGGWAHMVEAVRQARGECGPRQVKDAEISQYIFGPGVSLIFRR